MFNFDRMGNCLNPEVLYCDWAPPQSIPGKEVKAELRGEVKIEVCSDGRLCNFGGVITGNKIGYSRSTGFLHLMKNKHTEFGYDQWNDEKYFKEFIAYSKSDIELKAIEYFKDKIEMLTKRHKDNKSVFNHFFRWTELRNQTTLEL